MTITIFSHGETVCWTFICKNTDKFKIIEAKFYEKYPEYKKEKNNFIFNCKCIKVDKTLEDNRINDGGIIYLYTDN